MNTDNDNGANNDEFGDDKGCDRCGAYAMFFEYVYPPGLYLCNVCSPQDGSREDGNFEKILERLESVKKRQQLAETVKRAKEVLGCGDNSCLFVRPSGMATNSGCQCIRMARPFVAQGLARLFKAAQAFIEDDDNDNHR